MTIALPGGAAADPLAARLAALHMRRGEAGWPEALLRLAQELTLAEAGALLARGAEEWTAIAPQVTDRVPPAWASIATAALAAQGVAAAPSGGAGRWMFGVPVGGIGPPGAGGPPAVLVLEVASALPMDLALTRERLAMLAALAVSAGAAAAAQTLQAPALAAAATEALLRAATPAEGLHAAAALLARHLPEAERVVLALVRRRRAALLALSDQATPVAQAPLTRALRALLEEALDRSAPLAAPSEPPSAAQRAFAAAFGARPLLALPAADGGAALLVAGPAGATLPLDLTARLAPVVALLSLAGRQGRAARATRLRHPLPLAAGAIAALVGVLAVLPCAETVEAPFTLLPDRTQVVAAPFDGIVEASAVEPGDAVRGGETLLARLATREIALELAAARARAANDLREASIARAAGQPAQEQLALLSGRRAEAQTALLEYRLRLADIRAPADGVVVSGDLRRSLGQPVARGQTLFELALQGPLRADVLVLDERAAAVRPGQAVVLAPASEPGRSIVGRVERVRPLAELVQARNVFRTVVTLDAAAASDATLRPGMEGVARIEIGRTTWLGWLLAEPVRWLRRSFWL